MTPGTTVDPCLYELLRALAYGQSQRASAIVAGLGEADRAGEDLVLGVAFVHAVDRRFGRQADDDIDLLAAESVARQANGPEIADVGRLIRAALDQPHLVQYTDPATRTAAQRLVLRALLPRLVRGDAVDAFVDDVRRDVVRWLTPPVGVGAHAWRKA